LTPLFNYLTGIQLGDLVAWSCPTGATGVARVQFGKARELANKLQEAPRARMVFCLIETHVCSMIFAGLCGRSPERQWKKSGKNLERRYVL
jgi:hypothetical protein